MPCSAKPAASPQFSLWFFKRLPGAALPAPVPIQRPAAGGFPPADPASASRHRGRHGRPPPAGKGLCRLRAGNGPSTALAPQAARRALFHMPGIAHHRVQDPAMRLRAAAAPPRPPSMPGRLLPSRLATAAAVPVPTNGAKTTPPAGERAYHAPGQSLREPGPMAHAAPHGPAPPHAPRSPGRPSAGRQPAAAILHNAGLPEHVGAPEPVNGQI